MERLPLFMLFYVVLCCSTLFALLLAMLCGLWADRIPDPGVRPKKNRGSGHA